MSEEEKGKRFLELIDQQNTIQWKIITKLLSLVNSKWNSSSLQTEIESLLKTHYEITTELNSLDKNNRLL